MDRKTVISILFSLIMVASIFGVALDRLVQTPNTGKLQYGDYAFTVINQHFVSSINGKEYTFNFFPRDLEYLTLGNDTLAVLARPVVTITYDPQSDIAENMGEVQYYLEQQLKDVKVVERSLTNNTNTFLSAKTCTNATANQPVISLSHSNESSIVTTDNCIMVNAIDPYDLYQETERLLYTMLGVMQ